MKATHFLAVLILAVLLGYPLSFGPAVWWMSRHPGSPREHQIIVFYTPLFWAADHSDTFADAFSWYDRQWEYHPEENEKGQ